MKRRGIIFAFIFALLAFTLPGRSPIHAAAEGNPYWFHTVQDVVDISTKAPNSAEAFNKEFGDIGAGVNQQVGFILSTIGGCDSASNPNCPVALDFRHSTMAGLSNIALGTFTNPPASTYAFVSDIGKTLGFMPQVQAQGIGFSGLSVMLPLWKAFRNIAYALLAVIMIAIGFMVMFRKKIDPKTVVTVQNAIPRIVVALLLVTFSYAIVGIMIDLMYLSIILIVSVIGAASNGTLGKAVSIGVSNFNLNPLSGPVSLPTNTLTTPEVTSILLSGGVGKLLGFFFGSGFQAFNDIGSMLVGVVGEPVANVAKVAGPLLGFLINGPKGALAGTLLSGPVLLSVILVVILLFGFIRLVFMLLDAYINIIIALLTAPFQLMMEAIPGTNSFTSWFRNLLSKLIAFPITVILLLVAAILTSEDNSGAIWAPPLLSSGGGTFGMAGLIGLGMLMIIPTVVGGIQKAMKAEPMIPGGLGPIIGPLGQGVGQIVQLGYQGSFIASAVRHKPDARAPLQTAREGATKGFGSLTGGGEGH
ncbi:hypothetical protein KBC80_02925 [Candidatus Woesebacteria bacterium]|nr:hypothetical protein [Candidatus Woesebacteria bacterium]